MDSQSAQRAVDKAACPVPPSLTFFPDVKLLFSQQQLDATLGCASLQGEDGSFQLQTS